MAIKDKMAMTDDLKAELTPSEKVYEGVSSDGVIPTILNPCLECGRQAVEHKPDPKTRMPRMICCFEDCRHVWDGVPDRGVPGQVEAMATANMLNPCLKCGRQACEHSPDPVTKEPRMICMSEDCRHTWEGVPDRG